MSKLSLIIGLIIVFSFYSCGKTIGEETRTNGNDMRSIEADADTSSILISINRELRVGYEYYLRGNFRRALRIYKKAVRAYMKYDYRHRLATVYSNIGFIYLKTGELEDAKYYLEKSIELGEKHVLNARVRVHLKAVNYYKLALLFLFQGNYKKCMKYNEMSFNLNKRLSSDRGYSKNYRVYGLYYLKKKKIKKSFGYFAKALDINLKTGDFYDFMLNRISIAGIYIQTKKYDLALTYYNRALVIAKKRELPEKIGSILFKIGSLYELQKKYEVALNYYTRSYECDLNLETDEVLRRAREKRSFAKVKSMYRKLNKLKEFKRYTKVINFLYFRRFQE